LCLGLSVLATLWCVSTPLGTWQFHQLAEAAHAITAPILLFYPFKFLFTTLPRSLLVRFNPGLRDFHFTNGTGGLSVVTASSADSRPWPGALPALPDFSIAAHRTPLPGGYPEAEIIVRKHRRGVHKT
jgi:hypothetical protein